MCQSLRMWSVKISAIAVCMLAVALDASATTIVVRKDGTGDHEIVQHALQVAADGDTIRIGPGRYDEFFDDADPQQVKSTVAWITANDLTIIGAGSHQTYLGPASYYAPQGGASIVGGARGLECEISGVTLEGAFDALNWREGGLVIRECEIRNCMIGVNVFRNSFLQVVGTKFSTREGGSSGISMYHVEEEVVLENCEFGGTGVGVSAVGSIVSVTSSEFTCQSGIGTADGANVQVTNCTMSGDLEKCIDAFGNSVVIVADSYLESNDSVVEVTVGSEFQATSTVLAGGQTGATIRIATGSQATIHACHILNEGDYSVVVEGFTGDLVVQDLTENYWGTTDAAQVAAWILDGADDPGVHSLVHYLPMADGQVSTEKQSWDQLKAFFR